MISRFFEDPVMILITLPAVIIALTFHELAHAYTAVKLGDQTPAITGRLSINPLAHLDIMGFLCMVLTGFGWAKPVKVNPRNFNNPKRGMAITAAAGPLSNVLQSFVCMFILALLAKFNVLAIYYGKGGFSGASFGDALLMVLGTIVYQMTYLNLYLAIFNLIPVPPLDGSRLVDTFLPGRVSYYYNRYGTYFQIGLFAVMMILIYTDVFNPIAWVAGKVWDLFYNIWFGIFGMA
jgi:Zn-dependent protease